MPAVSRVGLDSHVGHASPTPNPFHQTPYAVGSPDVFTNSAKTVRIGDTTGCGDPASAGSPNVFANKIAVHRLGTQLQVMVALYQMPLLQDQVMYLQMGNIVINSSRRD